MVLSIITPVYNCDKYLEKCVISIINQSYKDWELILIDDGSKDNSPLICDRFASFDKRIKVIHQPNKGVVAARNAGISIAKGEWLAFVDADDWIEPDMYEKMIALSENKDIVWCDIKLLYPDHKIIKNLYWDKDVHQMLYRLLSGYLQGWLVNKIIKREYWDECDIKIDNNIKMMEDTVISAQLLLKKPRMNYIKEPLYNYNKCNESAATSLVRTDIILKAKDALIALDSLFSFNRGFKKALGRQIISYKICLANKVGIQQAKNDFFDYNKLYFSYPLSKIHNTIYWCAFNLGKFGVNLFNCYLFFKKLSNK